MTRGEVWTVSGTGYAGKPPHIYTESIFSDSQTLISDR